MINFEPNYWYVYIIRNVKNEWLYIGLHHQTTNKTYSNSSNSVLLQEAIDTGNVSYYTVWKGKNSEKAAALETYLINLAKNNNYSVYNRNSGGGYKGGARPKILTNEDCNMGENIILHKIYPKETNCDDAALVRARLEKIAELVKTAVKDKIDGVENPFKVVYEPVDNIIDMPFLQIRENAVNRENVEKVKNSMLLNMEMAKYKVQPISITRLNDGTLYRLDGTSTLNAILEINQWKTAPVVYLDLKEIFDENETHMRVYASIRNVPDFHKGGTDPKKELKNHVLDFYLKNQKLFDENIELFQKIFKTYYVGSYTEMSVVATLSNFIKNVKEQNSRGDNWYDYGTDVGKKILKNLSSKVLPMFPRSGNEIAHVAIASLENVGVGSNMNYLGNTSVGGVNTALVFAIHTSTKTEGKENHFFERYKNSLEEAGFVPNKSHSKYGYTPFVSEKTGKKIFVFFLPCRVDTKKRIDADYIFEQLFESESNEQIAA